jgi:hypothetical protein
VVVAVLKADRVKDMMNPIGKAKKKKRKSGEG